MIIIVPNSPARKGDVKGSIDEFEGRRGNVDCGNGETQSATCCNLCIRGRVGIGHERFQFSVGIPEAKVVLHCRGAPIGRPFYSPHATHKEMVGVF